VTPKDYEDRPCSECKKMFTPTRYNQVTCGKPSCVQGHRNKLANKAYHRKMAEARRLKKLEPEPPKALPPRESYGVLKKRAWGGDQSAMRKLEKRWFLRFFVLNKEALRPEGRALLEIYNS
jgi:hypothetical protein